MPLSDQSLRRLAAPAAMLVGIVLLTTGCGDSSGRADSGTTADPSPPADPPPFPPVDAAKLDDGQIANPVIPQEPSPFRFAEIATATGIDFEHFSGMEEHRHYPTANASGVAVFDADGDGRMDIYFATCTRLPLGTEDHGPNRLYLNNGDGTFRDATEESGLGFRGFCHGIVAADFDGDGDQDVFLACYGPNRLYRNDGSGHFTDVSADAGVENMARTVADAGVHIPGATEAERARLVINWASGGAPIDYDNDGDLDLYVAIHGDWRLPEDDQYCGFPERNIRLYCNPTQVRTAKDVLLRNDGDLTFSDVTDEAGLGRSDGHGFGVVAADLNGDFLTDLYVANDQTPNFLYLNRGDGTFADATETSGAAFDIDGQAQSGMGVDAEDVDGDGRFDLFVTNFKNEYNTLYSNQGNGFFIDTTTLYGLAQDSRPWTGWGCAFGDFDGDSWPDCFVVNGYVDSNHPDYAYAEPALLLRNLPIGDDATSRRYKLATRGVGPYFESPHVGRGVAFGDLDDDGDLDIVVNHKDAAPAILRNDTPVDANHWLRLDLTGTASNRDAVGAVVTLDLGDRTLVRQRKGGTSMLSTNDGRLLIGVGKVDAVKRLTVRWPSGAESVLEDVEVDRALDLIEPGEES